MPLDGYLKYHENYGMSLYTSYDLQPAVIDDAEGLRKNGRMGLFKGFPGSWNNNFSQIVQQPGSTNRVMVGRMGAYDAQRKDRAAF